MQSGVGSGSFLLRFRLVFIREIRETKLASLFWGGEHRDTVLSWHSSRFIPSESSAAWSSNPAGPTKGRPSVASCAVGASPRITTSSPLCFSAAIGENASFSRRNFPRSTHHSLHVQSSYLPHLVNIVPVFFSTDASPQSKHLCRISSLPFGTL